ncbi:MAG: amino acid racemase [Phycisphaerales bacterium]|jgi:aspartate racemase
MRTIGILGGLGPESTLEYYREIIKAFQKNESGYPKIVLFSANLREFWRILETEQRDALITWFTDKIFSLHDAGADFAVIASNTPHIVFDQVKTKVPIPMLSIVEETCKKAKSMGLKKCGLLGTEFTMQSTFYQKCFEEEGISMVTPDKNDQEIINEKIFSDLESGIINEQTKKLFLGIIKKMIDNESIDSVILACTELPLILTNDEYGIPFLSTTAIHINSIVEYCKK